MTSSSKRCHGCKRVLPKDMFTKCNAAKDKLNWRCKDCIRERSQRYLNGPKGADTRKRWAQNNLKKGREYYHRRNKEYRSKYPQKVKARALIAAALRHGYIKPPEDNKHRWYNRWEFHHPDYSRPYYGVWMRVPEHRRVDAGKMPCPPCKDYLPDVIAGIEKQWALSLAAIGLTIERE